MAHSMKAPWARKTWSCARILAGKLTEKLLGLDLCWKKCRVVTGLSQVYSTNLRILVDQNLAKFTTVWKSSIRIH
jgi:hypothetical protein